MANVFAILTALALVAASFLAYKNKEAYSKEIEDRRTAESDLAKNQTRLATLTEEFNATEAERKETQAAADELKGQETAAKKKNQDLTTQEAEKKGEVERNASRISQIEERLKEIGEIEELVGIIKRTIEETETLGGEIASGQAKLADLMAERSRTEAVKNDYRSRNENYTERRSYFSSTRIAAIYPTYGFVTLPIGNASGVVPGSRLDVVRDGASIAKLRVRTVESGRSAAEIIPDSLAEDVTLMVGDRVVPSTDSASN